MTFEIPEIVESLITEKNASFALSNGAVIVGYKLDLADLESIDIEAYERSFRDFLKSISPEILVRFILRSKASINLDMRHSRSQALQDIGYVENELFMLFESIPGPIDQLMLVLRRGRRNSQSLLEMQSERIQANIHLSFFNDFGIRSKPISIDDFKSLFPRDLGVIQKVPCGIDLGHTIIGQVRLQKQSTYPVSLFSLALLKDQLPLPYTITVTLENMSSQASETLLRRKSSQAEVGSDKIAANKYVKAQDDLAKIALQGGRVHRLEMVVGFERSSESKIRETADQISRALKPLGETYFETFGSAPTFISTLPGSAQHAPILETDESIVCYLPVLSQGTPESKKIVTSRSLALHRRDESLSYVDAFDSSYDSYSMNIFGPPGTGKSVLMNMFTRAILNDPSVHMTKLDVGGSHSRETRALGGDEFEISIERPTGINPFSYLRKAAHSPEIIKILSAFLETLIKEEHEGVLSKAIKADLESTLSDYSLSRPVQPTLDDFLDNQAGKIPRAKLLERWGRRGVYGNAFTEIPGREETKTRLRYYNFSKVSQALDGDFAQGGLAAVMSEFNFDMLFNRKGKRFIFNADEVPVFIQRAFDFFSLSIANIRKNGDAFITIAQRSEHVVVGGNTSILDNSPSKFFFAVDGNRELFAKRLNLEPHHVERIEGLQRRQGKFSEVFHQDQFGSRVYRIQLSPREYWSYTSKKEDKDKIEALSKAVPSLTLKEIIKCLAISS